MNRIAEIIYRHLSGQDLSSDELTVLKDWKESSIENQKIFDGVTDERNLREYLNTQFDNSRMEPAYQKYKDNIQDLSQKPILISLHRFIKYAAALILLIIGVYLWTIHLNHEVSTINVNNSKDIRPGYNTALLTLSDGSTVNLDSSAKKTIKEGSLEIYNANGELIYRPSKRMVFNTITTPKGGRYRLNLADGTIVWLNAESSITFPTAFNTDMREVQITGEAYFDVEKNAEKPFVVKTKKEIITVIGTSFNVNSYIDEPFFKTTLINGAVKVRSALAKSTEGRILQPGELYQEGQVLKADVEKEIAWKDGLFNFTGLDLKSVMRQLARWYNLEIIFTGTVPNIEISGEMGRDLNLSQVLKALEKMGLNFKINGNKLIVSP
jgi:transmembrane sensor